jgi:hypothetical protein
VVNKSPRHKKDAANPIPRAFWNGFNGSLLDEL